MANLELDEGFAMPMADSNNKQLEKQVSWKIELNKVSVLSTFN